MSDHACPICGHRFTWAWRRRMRNHYLRTHHVDWLKQQIRITGGGVA